MRVHIEDYFGNDVIKLDFALLDVTTNEERINDIHNISEEYGYSLADVDTDEQGEYIRIQQSEILDDSEEFREEEKVNLVNFITNLTVEFF